MVNVWKVFYNAYIFSTKKKHLVIGHCKCFSTSNFKMDKCLFNPPPAVSGMTSLKKELFKKSVRVPCLCVENTKLKTVSKVLKDFYLKLPNLKPTQSFVELQNYVEESKLSDTVSKLGDVNSKKVVLLDPSLVSSLSDIESDHEGLDLGYENLFFIEITIGYDNWNADKILRAIVPEEFDSVSSYSLVGHIVHLNLRKELNVYKGIIGQVLLEKIKQAKTVVNKVDNIDSTYRNFKMEVLCGDGEMVTRVKENNTIFEFDFSTVFWNPRLSTEHERITNKIKEGDVLYDVFAGVGPFSVPAAKKGCTVVANDLNPDSCKWLRRNCKLNKVERNVTVHNADGAHFIKTFVKDNLFKLIPRKDCNIHITMNLPALATSFLPNFRGLLNSEELNNLDKIPVPKLYVYCFSKGLEDPQLIAKNNVEKELGMSLEKEITEIAFVRNVAPNKEMMRVTLSLNEKILGPVSEKRPSNTEDSESAKKICQ